MLPSTTQGAQVTHEDWTTHGVQASTRELLLDHTFGHLGSFFGSNAYLTYFGSRLLQRR